MNDFRGKINDFRGLELESLQEYKSFFNELLPVEWTLVIFEWNRVVFDETLNFEDW